MISADIRVMIAVLIVIGLVAGGLTIGFVATSTAPVGFQDQNGFHFGPDQESAHEFTGVSQPA